MAHLWTQVRAQHPDAEFEEVDAAVLHSIEDFSEWFDQWITSASSARTRVLLVWHAHCLSMACQQMLRRSMEKRSYKNRVWFHTEEPDGLQSAILSRCVVSILDPVCMPQIRITGTPPADWERCWKDPVA